MHRRHWLLSALSTLGTAVILFARPPAIWADDPVSLEDRLKAGLKCRQPEEFAFVKLVAEYVDKKQLPVDLVLSTYRWAVEQRPNFPFYYFQYGLRRRAAAIGVDL